MPNELWIYDVIGQGVFESGVTSLSVRDEIAKMQSGERMTVRINSPGGYAREAVAIMSMLSQWKAGVDVIVEGLAASAASYIAMAGEKITVVEGSLMMVHNPSTLMIGTAKDMREAADYLDKVGDQLVNAYVKRTGMDKAKMAAMLDAETWMNPDEAIEMGFADERLDTVKAVAFAIPEAFGFKHPPQPPAEPEQRPVNRLAAMQRQLDLTSAACLG